MQKNKKKNKFLISVKQVAFEQSLFEEHKRFFFKNLEDFIWCGTPSDILINKKP